MNNSESVVFGMALGAGLMYFLDPDRGPPRPALVRDQITHAGHELDETARGGVRHARNRAVGLAHEAKASLTERGVADQVLEERVRSEVGRAAPHARLEVSARDGHVTLAGAAPSDEVQALVRAARDVRGVDSVDNRLEVSQRGPDGASRGSDRAEAGRGADRAG